MGNIFQRQAQPPIMCPPPPPCPPCGDCPECPECPECDSSSESITEENIIKTFILKHGDQIKKMDHISQNAPIKKLLYYNTLSDDEKKTEIDNFKRYIQQRGGLEVMLADSVIAEEFKKDRVENRIKRNKCYPGCKTCDGPGEYDCNSCTDGSPIENDDDGDGYGSCPNSPKASSISMSSRPIMKKLSSESCRRLPISSSLIVKPRDLMRKNICYSHKDGDMDGDILGRQCPQPKPYPESKPPLPLFQKRWARKKAVFEMKELERRLRCIDAKFDEYHHKALNQNAMSNNIQAEIVDNVLNEIDGVEPFDNNENYDLFIYILIIITLVYIFCKK